VRLATDDEVQAVVQARRGRGFELDPPRSYTYTEQLRPPASDEVYVVSQAFVEFADDEDARRWAGSEHHGYSLSVRRDVTVELLALAGEAAEDLVDLLPDMRIGGSGVTRWQLMSAPRRIELAPSLEARLAPLRRG
jgi:hypothetical protein